jgi:hypothetical protein
MTTGKVLQFDLVAVTGSSPQTTVVTISSCPPPYSTTILTS